MSHKQAKHTIESGLFRADLFSTDAMAEERLAELQGMCV